MLYKLLITLFFVCPALASILSSTVQFSLKDETTVIMEPVQKSNNSKDIMYAVLKDPDTCKTMRDGLPWPDAVIDNTFDYYVAAWETYDDMRNLGVTDHDLSFAFILKTADGQPVGLGGLQNSSRPNKAKEVYFELLPPYRQKGLGTQFGQYLVALHKKMYGDMPLEAAVVPENKPSKALLKRLGFKPLKDKNGNTVVHRFPKYNNRAYEIYRLQ